MVHSGNLPQSLKRLSTMDDTVTIQTVSESYSMVHTILPILHWSLHIVIEQGS